MVTRETFAMWGKEALAQHGGKATILEVSKYIWNNYEKNLRAYEETFYKWKYDVRWAARMLRENGVMKSVEDSHKGIWELK